MKVGDTFIWSPDGGREHLYIALTDPKNNGGRFVIFNLTKSAGGAKALTLKIGDHPYIKKYDSDVNFGDGLIVSLTRIKSAIASNRAFPDSPMDMKLVKKIAVFSKDHPAVSREIESMIKREWNLP